MGQTERNLAVGQDHEISASVELVGSHAESGAVGGRNGNAEDVEAVAPASSVNRDEAAKDDKAVDDNGARLLATLAKDGKSSLDTSSCEGHLDEVKDKFMARMNDGVKDKGAVTPAAHKGLQDAHELKTEVQACTPKKSNKYDKKTKQEEAASPCMPLPDGTNTVDDRSTRPGAYAVRHARRNVNVNASRNTTSATGTDTQEELFRQLQAQTTDSGAAVAPSSETAPVTVTSPPPPQAPSNDNTSDADAATATPEIPLLNALLVSDPPKGFDNCQICMTACDSGKGWEACKDQCVPDATFSCHNDTLGGMKTVQEYADFIAFFGTACPNARWTTHDVFWDGTTHTAFFHCTYHVTHTVSVPGLGPITPTHKSSDANYCYIIKTDPNREGKITHIQKLWNDTWLLRDLGWIPSTEDEGKEEVATEKQATADNEQATQEQEATEGDGTDPASTSFSCPHSNSSEGKQPRLQPQGQQQQPKGKRRVWGRLRKALGLSSSSSKRRHCSTTETVQVALP